MADMRATAECLGLSASLRAFPCGKGIYYYLLVSEKCRNSLIMLVNILKFQHVINSLNYANLP